MLPVMLLKPEESDRKEDSGGIPGRRLRLGGGKEGCWRRW
jgi:hypothetical protein